MAENVRMDECDNLKKTRSSFLLSLEVVIVKVTNETSLSRLMDYLVFALLGLRIPFDHVITPSLEAFTHSVP